MSSGIKFPLSNSTHEYGSIFSANLGPRAEVRGLANKITVKVFSKSGSGSLFVQLAMSITRVLTEHIIKQFPVLGQTQKTAQA